MSGHKFIALFGCVEGMIGCVLMAMKSYENGIGALILAGVFGVYAIYLKMEARP